jgi:glycosyltransferase involved in cell wall biosynthesis
LNPKVSIIIPNYNHAAFLQQRLDSVFNQTYQDFEVILLDDASTDGSVELLKTYSKHPKVSHFIVNPQNSGSPFKQWKKGIDLAQGDYIWIAESDDYCVLNFLETCVNAMQVNKRVGLAATGLLELGVDERKAFQPFKTGVYDGVEMLNQHMLRSNSIKNGSSVLFVKQALDVLCLNKLADFGICGDWWLWIGILKNNDLWFQEESLTIYRKHEDAVTHNLIKNPRFYNEVLYILRFISEDKTVPEHRFSSALQFWIITMKARNIPEFEKKQLIKKFRKSYSLKRKLRNKFFTIKKLITRCFRILC